MDEFGVRGPFENRKRDNVNLTRQEALERKEYRTMYFANGGVMVKSRCGRVVVGIVPEFKGSRTALMASSIASVKEKHINPARGELNVFHRLYAKNQFCMVPNAQSDRDRRDMARSMAYMMASELPMLSVVR